MKYRALCTSWVESLKKWYPQISIVSDRKGDCYAECDNEEIAEAIEHIHKLVVKLSQEKEGKQ